MTLDVYIPAIGQKELLYKCIAFLHASSEADADFTIIDNGSKEPLFSHSSLRHVRGIRNEENLGMVASLQQAVDDSEADILVYMHSDMFIFEPGWDRKIIESFEADPKLACLGVVGAVQADANGGRTGTVCAFRDWQNHGSKPTQKVTPVALLDGCFFATRRQVLVDLNLPDTDWPTHHFYDKDLSLSLTMASQRVGVIDLDCEHRGGETSCRPEYQEWANQKHGGDREIYLKAEARYINKWKPCFPVFVDPSWVVHVGRKS